MYGRKIKTAAALMALAMCITALFACNTDPKTSESGAPTSQFSSLPSAAPANPTAVVTEAPTAEPKVYYTVDEVDIMLLNDLEYGKDYISLYEKFGKDLLSSDVFEDENGMACIEKDGVVYRLGLDFLSKAMVYNTDELYGYFPTREEVYNTWWRYFITRFNYLLPELPMYCAEHYNVYNSMIKGVQESPVGPYRSIVKALIDWTSEKPENDIIIGGAKKPSGSFRLPSYSRIIQNASNEDILDLVNGLELYSITKDGRCTINETVVEQFFEETHENGNKEYRITICDDLKFSDGSPITALDYIAQPLASLTPIYRVWQRSTIEYNQLSGQSRFMDYDGPGDEDGIKELAGIRLYDEHTFGFIIDKNSFVDGMSDYYFELNLLNLPLRAIPKEVFIGNAEIRDDGNGCYLSDDYYKRDNEGRYLQSEVILDLCGNASEDALKMHPWSGPYTIEKYDADTGTTTLVRNPYFKGDYNGAKPKIEKIVYKNIAATDIIDDLKAGRIDAWSDFSEKEDIASALNAVESSGGKLTYTRFTGVKYGKLAFRCDFGPVQFAAVRRAIAYCLDREQFADDMFGGSGNVVDGLYNEDMSMYKSAVERGMRLNSYEVDLEAAIKCLEDDGWVYNADGSAYSGTGVRYKRIPKDKIDNYDKTYQSLDETYKTVEVGEYYYMPLVLNWCASLDNEFSDLLKTAFMDNENIAAAGIKIYCADMDFYNMLGEFYQSTIYHWMGPPIYCVFNFARKLNEQYYDYSTNFTVDPKFYDEYSFCFIRDTADIFFKNK